mmetsp:Transcript_2853/g.4283  ORF Transcript_2853/g.4283 Transcript_2853/m.4283 type:complete len:205 (+) Transcript_2853:771-1385(+)
MHGHITVCRTGHARLRVWRTLGLTLSLMLHMISKLHFPLYSLVLLLTLDQCFCLVLCLGVRLNRILSLVTVSCRSQMPGGGRHHRWLLPLRFSRHLVTIIWHPRTWINHLAPILRKLTASRFARRNVAIRGHILCCVLPLNNFLLPWLSWLNDLCYNIALFEGERWGRLALIRTSMVQPILQLHRLQILPRNVSRCGFDFSLGR